METHIVKDSSLKKLLNTKTCKFISKNIENSIRTQVVILECKQNLLNPFRQFSLFYFQDLRMTQTVTLSSGYEMPVVGFGTWQIADEDVDAAVIAALECGYKHIDTAFFYQNEEGIGRGLKKWFDEGNEREDLFITTKLPPFGMRAHDVETFLKLSLERLGLDYVDNYMIHMPWGFVKEKDNDAPATDEDGNLILDNDTNHLAIWKAMEEQVENGLVKSISVSNFNEAQLLNLIENAQIKPSNIQLELNAYHQQRPMRELCSKYGIIVTAYSSLGSPGSHDSIKTDNSLNLTRVLDHPTVLAISEKHGKTPAQVLLRHQIQAGLVVIPKSTNPERLAENIQIFNFALTEDEMQQLDELDKGEEGRLFSYENFFKGVEAHPEYPL